MRCCFPRIQKSGPGIWYAFTKPVFRQNSSSGMPGRKKESLRFHFNASLPGLNLAGAEARESHPGDESAVFSMASHKTKYFNVSS